jgi:hypothetical protein
VWEGVAGDLWVEVERGIGCGATVVEVCWC